MILARLGAKVRKLIFKCDEGLIVKTDGVRIINVSSTAHHYCKQLDVDDLTFEKNATADKFLQIYGITKLCSILFTNELAKRLEPLGINY